MWLCFISIAKDEWAGLVVLSLQLWIYITVFQSRTRIRLLTEDLTEYRTCSAAANQAAATAREIVLSLPGWFQAVPAS
ncbi:hypothetical protein CEXT_296261 [Caerostris extrusa]|uniref:Uncharacterized protein n=1 Tax=Caerostris extrusa TaxID=172846 RepID=A0AAV4M810_CAEEX|nr:hypothetical protein CEXT_296261 [Caerostris extrusa]